MPRAGLTGRVTEGATDPAVTGVGETNEAEAIGEVAFVIVFPYGDMAIPGE